MSKLQKHRPLRAVVAGCAGALVLAASMGGVAFAAPVTPHNVDPDATANLVVVKQKTPSGVEANGLVNDAATNDPVAGVTFKVQKVGEIDLATNAGWTAAAQLTVADAKAGPLDEGVDLVTDQYGVADFEGLKPGLYLVTETKTPADVTPAAPFLVTLPMTDPTDTSKWILDEDQDAPGEAGSNDYYQVTVYPKNSIVGADKAADDGQDVELGDDITYTLTGDIPEIKGDLDDAAYAASVSYAIADNYDAKLTYLSTDSVKIVNSETGAVVAELVKDVDYKSADRTNKDGSHSQVVTLTVEGLKKLKANGTTISNDVRLVVEMTFEANATGELVNTATVYPNGDSQAWTPGETDIPMPPTTPAVATKWGEINIHKTNAKDGSDLAGAEFQLYALFGKAGNEAFTKDDTKLVDLNADGTGDTFTSLADGSVVISGLRYSDFANNAGITPEDDNYITYWLVETKAPNGFELLAQPIKIELTDTTTDSLDASVYELDVANSPHNGGFQLPLTGGPGTLALTVGGALVLGGAVVLIVRSARRRATN